ncbi:iron chelate uptake ABC transporter family permease subunit [Alkalihalobacillus sp. AL-G]|uniref:FecCD family ABC transporter permease n=1 Tax=Alkalihalobacillus sp. AL-G TaxID=2926399 RepID=UPI00272B042F|nr:iron ABC transporter permease [Alkalihalobacillus sp. AL-G]WLD93652.1 iron ABC transporter permease [Alkalihalobacillus sp. AL-G]
MARYRSIRNKAFSLLFDTKTTWIVLSLAVGFIALMILSIGVGQLWISPIDVVKSMFGYGEDMQNLVVRSFRMPRIILALLAGAGLALSGAILQGIIRNPLASPDIIGITGGAAVATVGFLAAFSDRSNSLTVSIHWMPLASFLGAVIMGFLVYLLAWRQGVSPIRLVLIGIGLSAAAQAFTTMMMILGPIFTASKANIWITGSVNGTNWSEITTLLPWMGILFIAVFIMARRLNIQELGADVATGAGSKVQKDRMLLLFLSTALAGGSVAFAGGIGFVGLMAPHIARKLVGSSFGGLLMVSALIGGIVVMGADLIARTAFAPLEVPAGVFTSAIGAPYFIYLLYRNRNK